MKTEDKVASFLICLGDAYLGWNFLKNALIMGVTPEQLENSHVQYFAKATTTTTLTHIKTQTRSHLRVLATELITSDSESTSNTDTLNTT